MNTRLSEGRLPFSDIFRKFDATWPVSKWLFAECDPNWQNLTGGGAHLSAENRLVVCGDARMEFVLADFCNQKGGSTTVTFNHQGRQAVSTSQRIVLVK